MSNNPVDLLSFKIERKDDTDQFDVRLPELHLEALSLLVTLAEAPVQGSAVQQENSCEEMDAFEHLEYEEANSNVADRAEMAGELQGSVASTVIGQFRDDANTSVVLDKSELVDFSRWLTRKRIGIKADIGDQPGVEEFMAPVCALWADQFLEVVVNDN